VFPFNAAAPFFSSQQYKSRSKRAIFLTNSDQSMNNFVMLNTSFAAGRQDIFPTNPKSAKDVEIVKLRTRTVISVLMKRIGCLNANQFGAWINKESERLGWKDTQQSNKWYKLIDGRLTNRPDKTIVMLSQLFDDAEHVYNDGPANLWRALWGNAADPSVLWPLCRTRFDSNGPWLDEITWKDIEAKYLNERTFRETIREFEGELLLAMAYDEPLTLNHLTESVALYRLHQATNCLARSDVDGVGAYRCIRHCLDEPRVRLELNSYNALNLLHAELVKIEIERLTTERSYLASVGIQGHQVELYANDPLSCIDTDTRWDTLNLDWAQAAPTTAVAGARSRTVSSVSCGYRRPSASPRFAAEVLESAGYKQVSPGRFLPPSNVQRGVSHGKVVHMQSWVEDKVERR
jgi:hypothetical protein